MYYTVANSVKLAKSPVLRKKPSDLDFAAISQFNSLKGEELDHLRRESWLHGCKRGVFEFRNIESECENIYFIIRGIAFLYDQTQENKSMAMRIFTRGDFFSRKMLFSSELKITSSRDAKLLSVPVDFFRYFCDKHPAVLRAHCEYLEDLHNRQLMLAMFGSMESESRIVAFLRMFTSVNKEFGMLRLSLGRLVHQQIADCTGLSRETITRKFSKKNFQNWKQLAKEGMIQVSREEIIEMGFA